MPVVDQAAPEAVKLPDPNDPRYADARAKMANLFFAIGREDSRNGYGAMADDLMCGDLMQVPTWIALGMLAEATSLLCKSGEGAGERGGMTAEQRVLLESLADNPRILHDVRLAIRAALTPDATQTREAEGAWLPISDDAKSGAMVELVVDYSDGDHPLADGILACTIGFNTLADTGLDEWKFAGWCWTHDHFVQGKGTPVAWRPSRLNATDDGLPALPARDAA